MVEPRTLRQPVEPPGRISVADGNRSRIRYVELDRVRVSRGLLLSAEITDRYAASFTRRYS